MFIGIKPALENDMKLINIYIYIYVVINWAYEHMNLVGLTTYIIDISQGIKY